MAKNLFAERIRLNLVDLVNQTGNFTAGGGAGGAAGSVGTENGTGAVGSPTRLWLKTGAPAYAWTRQNYALRVFNVKDFGATGNGVTNDLTSVRNTITAAIAAGGGIVYFPRGQYAFFKSGIACFDLNGASDLLFLGDGYASKLLLVGSAGFGDWFMFRIQNSTRLRWYNLSFNAEQISDPDPAEQTHAFVPTTNCTECEAAGLYFEWFDGDAFRFISNLGTEVVNFRILYCAHDMRATTGLFTGRGCRANVSFQRGTTDVQLKYLWMTGSDDQELDFEPTAAGGMDDFEFVGNIALHQNVATGWTISSNDPANPVTRLMLANNIMMGGVLSITNSIRVALTGNIITSNANTDFAVCDLGHRMEDVSVVGNVFAALTNVLVRSTIRLEPRILNGAINVNIADNILYNESTGTIIDCQGALNITVVGNALRSTLGAGVGEVIITFDDDSPTGNDNCIAIGNLCRSTTGVNPPTAGIRFASGAANQLKNTVASGNLVDGCIQGVRYERTALHTANDYCGENLCEVTNLGVEPGDGEAVESGLAADSSAVYFYQSAILPEGAVAARNGSMLVNGLGTDSSIIWVKETGTGNTGWFRAGAKVLEFGVQDAGAGTALVFLAPGFDLTSPSATEIQIACPRPGTLRNLRVQCVAGTGGGNVSYVLRVNGATVITATLANTSTTASETSTVVQVAAGDLISIGVTKTVAPATAQTFVVVSFVISS